MAADTLIGAAGGGSGQLAYRAYQGVRAGVGITRSAYIGALGEEAAGVAGAKQTIQSITGTASVRRPDKIDDAARLVREVKNKATLNSRDAAQIADDVAYAKAANPDNPYAVNLVARFSTDVSRVQPLINSGDVSLSYLPGIANDGFAYLSPYVAAGIGGVLGAGTGGAGSASGGYLLYPNKANTNMMQSVYSK